MLISEDKARRYSHAPGALDEIAYALDTLGADGIGLSSSYGEGENACECSIQGPFLSDHAYIPKCMSGTTHSILSGKNLTDEEQPSSCMVPRSPLRLHIPIHFLEYQSQRCVVYRTVRLSLIMSSQVPNETFKAAAHLVVTGKKRRFSRVKIILAHLGGSAPFLAPRVAVLSAHMGCILSPEECIEDFSSFYFDTALSSHRSTLGMDAMRPERLLFGTDYPGMCIWRSVLCHNASQASSSS